jgi:hypothetical protein
MTISEEDVTGLVTTLNGLTLPPGQRELLDAILKVVADIQERFEGQAFAKEFNEAFTKQKADLVMEYVSPPPDTEESGIIKRSDENAIIRNPGGDSSNAIIRAHTSPPGIIRNPPDPNPDDNNENNDEQP